MQGNDLKLAKFKLTLLNMPFGVWYKENATQDINTDLEVSSVNKGLAVYDWGCESKPSTNNPGSIEVKIGGFL